jgi:RNA polymerase sigma factor (sigma-70 family)
MLQLDLGDKNAADELFRRYLTRMAHWCRRLGVPASEIDDAVNEACRNIVEGLNSYDRSRGSFQAWCRRVTRNAAISLYRKARRHDKGRQDEAVPLDQQPDDATDPAEQVAEQMDRDVEWALTQTALRRIAQRYRPEEMQAFHRPDADEPARVIAHDLDLEPEVVYRLYYTYASVYATSVDLLAGRLEAALVRADVWRRITPRSPEPILLRAFVLVLRREG